MAQTKVNGAVEHGNGLGPKTIIVSVNDSAANLTSANLESIINWLGSETATGTAFVTAGVSGNVEAGVQTVHLALQGTGDVDTANADLGLANHTVAVVATFMDH